MRRATPLLLALAIGSSAVAHDLPGPFRGDEYRYPHKSLVARAAADVVAIPTGIPRWSASEWVWFGATVGVTVGLFLPLDSPLDMRFQNYLLELWPKFRPGLWSPTRDVYIFGGVAGVVGGVLGYGWLAGDARFLETVSLVLETLLVVQTYHIGLKLLISRDGPDDGDGKTIAGPSLASFRRFANGAPSGHAATLFAFATLGTLYWRNPVLSVVLYTVATGLSAALVLDRYHYISDVLAGASMGVAMGRYVVIHRSSRYSYVEGRPKRRTALVPVVLQEKEGATLGAAIRGEL